ncbi:YheC/YheD family endospore coat-associated protein [Rossellomorea aquimaris]|uniref:YheC/YheD family endospore coat-associated protein n=1 Tax=Rossellomorea aquimaris TaxID=189382 RepID=UPI0007D09193|nr:YheC/YheD family protein [Rossellomorea aquimaris]
MNTSLGIMTLNPDISNTYFLEIAYESLSYNIDLYLFSPQGISPLSETVDGFYFNPTKKTWEKEAFEIPSFIYDRTYYQKDLPSRQAKAVVQWLKNQKYIQFLSYGLPNKWLVYETLKETSLSSYLPETTLVTDGNQLLHLLLEQRDSIIKPVDGAHGFAVYQLLVEGKNIKVRTTKKHGVIEKTFTNNQSFLEWGNHILKQHTFIYQKRLSNYTSLHTPFDLRVLMNKDSRGEWRVFQKAIREGKQNGILTNISYGASYLSYKDWKHKHQRLTWNFIEEEITDILEDIPLILEDSFSPLFEIGVDIVIANDDSIWILDINSKPGHKAVHSLGAEKLSALHKAPLDYCEFLAELSLTSIRRGEF